MFPGEPTGQLRSSTTGRGLSTDSGGEAPLLAMISTAWDFKDGFLWVLYVLY